MKRAAPGAIHVSMPRVTEIISSLIVILFLSPVFVLLTALVFVQSEDSVFVVETRRTADGRQIKGLKFRTSNSGSRRSSREALAYEPKRSGTEPSPFQQFMITTGLDRLPQLFSVIAGNMHLSDLF